jgi:hypothetical protein
LTEEKFDDIGARLERSPIKSLAKLAQQADVSVSSARTATKWLKLRLYKITQVYSLQPRDQLQVYMFATGLSDQWDIFS